MRWPRRWCGATRRRGSDDPGRAGPAGVRYVGWVVNKNAILRRATRAGVVGAATAALLLVTSPVFALTRDDGDDPGSGLSVAQTLGLFVGIPLLAFAVICALVLLPSMGKKRPSDPTAPSETPSPAEQNEHV